MHHFAFMAHACSDTMCVKEDLQGVPSDALAMYHMQIEGGGDGGGAWGTWGARGFHSGPAARLSHCCPGNTC